MDRVFKQPMASPVAEGLRFTSSGGRSGPHPDGPGSDLVNGNCLACHSAGMVLTQPALSPMQWRAEVEKMRTAYKAQNELEMSCMTCMSAGRCPFEDLTKLL